MSRKILFGMVFIIALLCLGLFFTEIFLRIGPVTVAPGDVIIRNSLTHHDYIPGATFIKRQDVLDGGNFITNRINSIGIRGPELGEKKCYRVLLIGDSFIQAEEVPFKDTFSERLNSFFNGRIEFIAHGIASWSPTTEFSWIYNKGLNLLPDEIIIFLCANDFYRPEAYYFGDALYRSEAIYNGDIPIGYRVTEPRTSKIKMWLKKSRTVRRISAWLRLMAYKISDKKKSQIYRAAEELILFDQDHTEWPLSLRENVDNTIEVMKSMNRYLEVRAIKMRAVFIPFGFEWENESIHGKKDYGWEEHYTVSQKGLENYLRENCGKAGISYINLADGFRKEKAVLPEVLLFNGRDAHWNANGHYVIFRLLRDYYSMHEPQRGAM